MYRDHRSHAACLLALFAAIACGAPAPLNEATLRNGTYPSHEDPTGYITLEDGSFENQEQRLTVTMEDAFALGDLDGDGRDDAVVFLAVNTGGTGNFVESAVVLDRADGRLSLRGSRLGDRTQVDAVRIADGRIVVALTTHAETDPMCCPTLKGERQFEVAGNLVSEIEGGLPAVATSPPQVPTDATASRSVSEICGVPLESEGDAFLTDAYLEGNLVDAVLIEGTTEAIDAQLRDAIESASELGFGLCVSGTYEPSDGAIAVTEAYAVTRP